MSTRLSQNRAAAGLVALVAAALIAGVGVLGSLAARPKPQLCPDGRYLVVQGPPLLSGVATTPAAAVTIAEGQITLDGACPQVAVKQKAKRRGTSIKARWPECPGVVGPVRLRGLIEPTCQTFTGKVTAKKSDRHKEEFRTLLSTCGDGVLDPDNGEECEADQDCTPPETCPACACIDQQTTTTSAPGGSTTSITGPTIITSTSLAPGTTTTTSLPTEPGPDPATVAPPNDPTVAPDFAAATAFLFAGSPPIQFNVNQAALESRRIAVLRGKVTLRDGSALSGVLISVQGHPEFGQTLSRTDGGYDLAVNGGGTLVLNYAIAGFLPAQRSATDIPWRDFRCLPDIVLLPVDAQVTAVSLGAAATTMQVAQGSAQTDGDGTRRTTLLVPPGTQGSMRMPDGSSLPLGSIAVRATEYTVGTTGPSAMPGQLPSQSGYTFAVELSADEALGAGATRVDFDRPLPTYVENFLDLPAGTPVPAGFYDREKAAWIPSDDGRVIDIVGSAGGLVDLDVTGDGVTDVGAALTDLGVTDEERQRLASLYPVGQSLWRVPVTHFTPWDYNWPFGLPDGATPPLTPPAQDGTLPVEGSCEEPGSIVHTEDQTLGELTEVVGTPYTLHYSSDRVPGRNSAIDVPLAGDTVPPGLKRIGLTMEVAGQLHQQTFAATPGQRTTFVWDGIDAYGRPLSGSARVHGKIDYVYDAVYRTPGDFAQSFASFGGVALAGSGARQEITASLEFDTTIDHEDARAHGLGGWMLDVHHAYDPQGQILRLGDGRRRRAEMLTPVIGTANGTFALTDVVAAPDGSVYTYTNIIVRRAPDGSTSTVAGGGNAPLPGLGDGGPAVQAKLSGVADLALGPDGSIYFGDGCTVRRVDPKGIITTVAGFRGATITEECTWSVSPEDGVPATSVPVIPRKIAVAGDGSVHFWEYGISAADDTDVRSQIRRIDAGEIIRTVAGGATCFDGTPCGDTGVPVAAVKLQLVDDIAFAPDGSLYVLEEQILRRFKPDGLVEHVAGVRAFVGITGSGGPASTAFLCNAHAIAVAPDGVVYVAENNRIRRITTDGLFVTVGGPTAPGSFGRCDPDSPTISGDGGPSLGAGMAGTRGITVAPDGSIFTAGAFPRGLGRIGRPLPGVSGNDFPVVSADGNEIYVFAGSGRHLRTLGALTGVVLREFTYGVDGRLATVVEKTGSIDAVTTIERDENGAPTAIVGPFGDRTTLAVDSNGYLARITNPAGEKIDLSYTATGLLGSLTDQRGKVTTYDYDTRGRFIAETDPAGGGQALGRTDGERGFRVVHTTALGLTTTFATENETSGALHRTVTAPDGTQNDLVSVPDGSRSIVSAEGTTITERDGPDPRFGMLAPLLRQRTVQTPGGLTRVSASSRTASFQSQTALTSQTETLTVNGVSSTVTYTKAAEGGSLVATSPAGRSLTYVLDGFARLTEARLSGLEPVTAAYDDRGRMAELRLGSGPSARLTTFAYDAAGRLQRTTDPLGRDVQFGYDSAGRPISHTFPDARAVGLGYDLAGNLVRVTPPGRPDHTFAYSDRNELVQLTPPAGPNAGPTTYDHDLDGRLTMIGHPDDTAVNLEYDAGGRLVHRVLSSGAVMDRESVATYDPLGRFATLTSSDGVDLAFTYDGHLRTSETMTGSAEGSVAWNYDARLRMVDETVAGTDPVAFTYDADDLLTGAGPVTIARHPQHGLPTATTLGVVSDAMTYDVFGAPLAYSAVADSTPLYEADYTRDAIGRLTQQIETVGGSTSAIDYTYDLAGRLIEVHHDGLLVEEYGYDDNGNRTSATAGGPTRTATFDDRDRLEQDGTTSYAYTAAGRLLSRTTSGQTTQYAYDAFGNLRGVTLPNGTTIDYRIDGFDRRVGKRVDGVFTQGFLWADDRIVAELDGTGAVVGRFVTAGARAPLAVVRDGVTYRIVTDQLGSVRLVVATTTGAVVQRLSYDAFGNVTQDTNPGFQPFGFAGGLYDVDTGLARFGARDYDARGGRWTAPDRISFGGGDTNLYRYAGGDPVNVLDPTGLSTGGFASGFLEGLTSFDSPVLMITGIGPILQNFFDPLHAFPEELRNTSTAATMDPFGMGELGIDSVSEIVEVAAGLRQTADEYEDDPANTAGFVCGLLTPAGGPKAASLASRGRSLLSRGRGLLDALASRLKNLLTREKPKALPKPRRKADEVYDAMKRNGAFQHEGRKEHVGSGWKPGSS
jgi:RHS repeat-associated protein